MKKFQVLAGIASTVAIASSIALADAGFASPCTYSKSGAVKSGSATTPIGSGGEGQMNSGKSCKTAALGFLGLAGVLGGGAAYMSYRTGKRASAACAAMSDNFEVFEESIANGCLDEYLEIPGAIDLTADAELPLSVAVIDAAEAVAVVREHPEAPGGELDLGSSAAIESVQSAIVQ
jgi:hypothetical protein